MNKYHFIGIGGVGMSALAEAALHQGFGVSGSDRLLDAGQESQVIRALRAQGALLFPQDGSGIADDTAYAVVSTAIEEDNPDLLAAQQRGGIEVIHRSAMLGLLTKGIKRRIAVGGTCGKSTVTGMSGWLLAQSELDPVVINGAPLADWIKEDAVGSSRAGEGDLCVFEADESDRSLLNYDYEIAVITNSSADHFSKEEADALFDAFAGRAAEGVLDARELSFYDDVSFTAAGFRYKDVEFTVPMPGRHNLSNAALSVKICEQMGCALVELAEHLSFFKGVSRRLEFVGRHGDVCVYDDYAHNTEKMRAVWRTLSERHGSVIGVWRPHGYGPLKSMMGDLVEMFSEAVKPGDMLVVLPVYDAGGTADRTVNSDELVRRLVTAGVNAFFAETPERARKLAAGFARDGAAIATMGARDPGLPALAGNILAELNGV